MRQSVLASVGNSSKIRTVCREDVLAKCLRFVECDLFDMSSSQCRIFCSSFDIGVVIIFVRKIEFARVR